MTANPVVLILGAGSNIGASVATKFSSNGYKVALVSRSGTGSKTAEGYLSLKADLTQPDAIPPVFEAVKAEFNVAPIVVVYNAYSMEFIPKDGSIFSISAEKFQSDLVVNSVTSYVAAQQAVTAWKSLPEETQKTFIYTGNYLDTTVASVPDWLNLGVGKGASAYWVGLADILHAEKGIRFFYADERAEDGSPMFNGADGPSHGEFYAKLANHEESKNWPWRVTFTKEKGYATF